MELYCSAGISHFLIYPNGDIYRCMADYNARYEPLGNLLTGGLRLPQVAQVCKHPKCYAACDVDWATKWIIDEKGKIERRIEAQATVSAKCYHRIKFWANQNYPDKLLKRFAHIIWTPTLLCNYDCAYCGCAQGVNDIKKGFPSSFPELSIEQWISVFKNYILPNFEWVTVTLAGGEPLLSRSLIPVLKIISEKCSVNITTNFSLEVMDFTREKIKPLDIKTSTGISFTGSLHPTANKFSLDTFLAKILYLKNNGFPCNINFVAYPEQMYLIDYYRNLFNRYGIEIIFSPWCGTDNHGRTGYLPEEEEFLNSKTVVWRKTDTQIDFNKQYLKEAYRAEITLLDGNGTINLNKDNKFRLKIRNTGKSVWPCKKTKNLDFKFGSRLIDPKDIRNPIKGEFRTLFAKDILPGFEEILEISINPSGLLSNREYILKFDIVNEHNFWLEDLGSRPLLLNTISNKKEN